MINKNKIDNILLDRFFNFNYLKVVFGGIKK